MIPEARLRLHNTLKLVLVAGALQVQFQSKAFHDFMKARFAGRTTWLGVYNFEVISAKGVTPETPILVDVRDGIRQQCQELKEKVKTPGRVVL